MNGGSPTQPIPMIMHRCFRRGEGWAFHPSLDRSLLELAKRLSPQLKIREHHQFSLAEAGGQTLVGAVWPDDQCADPGAIDRMPTIVVAAVLRSPPTEADIASIIACIKRKSYPQCNGPHLDLTCELPSRQSDCRPFSVSAKPWHELETLKRNTNDIRNLESHISRAIRKNEPAALLEHLSSPRCLSNNGRTIDLTNISSVWSTTIGAHVIDINDPSWGFELVRQDAALILTAHRPIEIGGGIVTRVYRYSRVGPFGRRYLKLTCSFAVSNTDPSSNPGLSEVANNRTSAVRMPTAINPLVAPFVIEIGSEPHALVIQSDDCVIGHERNSTADIRIRGPVQFRHARLSRHGGCYAISPFWTTPDLPYRVDVDAKTMPGKAIEFLKPTCMLCLEEPVCQWDFRTPIQGSATAVLEVADGCHSAVILPDGRQVRRVILLADQCVIGPTKLHSHLILSQLLTEFVISRSSDRLTLDSQNADLAVFPVKTKTNRDGAISVDLPVEVEIRPRMKSILRAMLAGGESGEPIKLRLTPVFASGM